VETRNERRARGWARTGLLVGLGLSLAGNEAHVWGEGFPGWGPAVASVVWPALLFIAVEIVLHMGAGHAWAKWVGLGSVALVSGAVSYWHLSSVLHGWGYGWLSYPAPLAVDGLMVLSTVVLTKSAVALVEPEPARTPVRVFAGPHSIPVAKPEPLWFPEPEPAPEPPQPAEPVTVPKRPSGPKPAPDPQRRPQGVHIRDGRMLRGPELEADAVGLVRMHGLSNAELAGKYTPPLKERKAQEFGAKGRRSVNGHVPAITH
jgi:hypothetical protein